MEVLPSRFAIDRLHKLLYNENEIDWSVLRIKFGYYCMLNSFGSRCILVQCLSYFISKHKKLTDCKYWLVMDVLKSFYHILILETLTKKVSSLVKIIFYVGKKL